MKSPIPFRLLLLLGSTFALGCTQATEPTKPNPETSPMPNQDTPSDAQPAAETKLAMFGGGCFWCTEAFFERLPGIVSVTSGYAGGSVDDPSYKQVCRGDTGHAEVVQITYQPSLMSYERLLEIFFKSHDPTTLNRQGADVGTQYRSVIFYFDDEQKAAAEKAKTEAAKLYSDPVVTEITSAAKFYEAEDYHQDYLKKNPYAPYSMFIKSKMHKFDQKYGDK